MNSRIARIGGLVVLMIIGLFAQSQAQAQDDDPFAKYRISSGVLDLVNISWAFDSTRLVFQESDIENSIPIEGVNTAGVNTWRQYSVLTQQTTTDDFWPLQPSLTPAQMSNFEVNSADSFIFMAPDNCRIVYGGTSTGVRYYLPLGIANVCTNQHRILTDLLIGDPPVFDNRRIHWAFDSSAFTLENWLGAGFLDIYHISGLDNLTNPTIVMLNNAPKTVNNTPFYTDTVFDVSTHGSQLLLYGRGEQGLKRFVRWDMETDFGVEIPIDGTVVGATFFDQNQQSVLWIDAGGLKKYDGSNGQVTLFDATITSIWAKGGAYFSPDGQYVALYDFNVGGRNNLYVMPITDPASITPTPSATPILTPTPTLAPCSRCTYTCSHTTTPPSPDEACQKPVVRVIFWRGQGQGGNHVIIAVSTM